MTWRGAATPSRSLTATPNPAGRLRDVPESELPAAVLDAEIALLAGMGIEFKTGIELGNHVTLDGLRRGFDAILLAVGELAKGDGEKLGLPPAGGAAQGRPVHLPAQSAQCLCRRGLRQASQTIGPRHGRGARRRRVRPPLFARPAAAPAGEAVFQHHGPAGAGRIAGDAAHRQPGAQRAAVRPLRRIQRRRGGARRRRAACIATAGRRATACCSTTPKSMAPTPAGSARSAGPSSSSFSPAASSSSRASAFSAGFA